MSALLNRSAEPRMSDYDAEKADFRLEVPEVFNPVIDIVEKWAAESPDDLALVSLDGEGGVVAEQTVADLALRVAPRRPRPPRRRASARATASSSCCRASPPGTRRCSARSGSAPS